MFPSTSQQVNNPADHQVSAAHENSRSQFSFDPEFSLPSYFFDKDFLDNADLCEPHVKEKRQPENDPLRKRTRLPEQPQEYRC